MSLLVDMMTNTLDEAYAERAARAQTRGAVPQDATADVGHGEAGPPGRAPRSRLLVSAVALLVVGLVTGTAVAQVRGGQVEDTGLRGRLAGEVVDRRAESDRLSRQATGLREELADTRASALGIDAAGRALAERLARVGLQSATVPVEGPGVVVTLDDPDPDGERSAADLEQGRVRDTDVADAVNALWAAGAEAVAVNGQRLTALTAIRSAGAAIQVDLLPLTPPYEIRAIGDRATLELGLLDGPTGRRLTTYASAYGLRLDVRRSDELRLPGAADPTLRAVAPAPEAS